MKYRVEFKDGRVGRDRDVQPVEWSVQRGQSLERTIAKALLPHLASKHVEVVIYWEARGDSSVVPGRAWVGVRPVAQFDLIIGGK